MESLILCGKRCSWNCLWRMKAMRGNQWSSSMGKPGNWLLRRPEKQDSYLLKMMGRQGSC